MEVAVITMRSQHRRSRLCQYCQKKFGYIVCLQCNYHQLCSTCNERIHSQITNQNHTTTTLLSHAQQLQTNNDKSIKPHISNAVKIIQEIEEWNNPACQNIKLMELREIENELQIQKEMKKEEERLEHLAKLSREVSEIKHRAAIRLQSFFQCLQNSIKTRKHLQSLRQNMKVSSFREKEQEQAVVTIQKSFRRFSVTVFLQRNGLFLRSNKLSSSVSDCSCDQQQVATDRVERDFHNRRIYERSSIIFRFCESQKLLNKVVESESNWLKQSYHDIKNILHSLKDRINTQEQHLTLVGHKLNSLAVSSPEFKRAQIELEVHKIKKKHCSYLHKLRLSNAQSVEIQIRHFVRLQQKSNLLSQNTHRDLRLLYDDTITTRSILDFVKNKAYTVEKTRGNLGYREWLKHQEDQLVDCLIGYDTSQEVTLSNGNERIRKELDYIYSAKRLFMQLWDAMHAQCSYISESIALEIELKKRDEGDDKAFVYFERLEVLNEKQKKLREGTIPTLQTNIEKIYQELKKDIESASVKYVGDNFSQDLEDMVGNIKAVLHKEEKERDPLCKEEWMNLFYSQPWVGKQMVEESHLDQIRHMEYRAIEWQRLKITKEKETLEYDYQKASLIEDILEGLRCEREKPEKSKFKRMEIDGAYQSLKNKLDEIQRSYQSREDAIANKENDIEKRLREMSVQELEAIQRKADQQIAMDEFQRIELQVERQFLEQLSKEEAELQSEEITLKTLLLRESIKKEKNAENGKACEVPSFDGQNSIKDVDNAFISREFYDSSEVSIEWRQRYDDYKMRETVYESKRQKVHESMKKRKSLFEKAKIQAKSEITFNRIKELQKTIRFKRDVLLSNCQSNHENEPDTVENRIKWPSDSEIKSIRRLISFENIKEEQPDFFDFADFTKRGSNLVLQMRRMTGKQKDDPEAEQMKTIILKTMNLQQRKIEAISNIRFSVGKLETEIFAKENYKLQESGFPFFRRLKKEIGTQDQITVWIQKTANQKDFVTAIKLAHSTFGHPLHVDLAPDGYNMLQHPKMKGEIGKDPTLCVWYRKDFGTSSAICDLDISYSLAEEENLRKENFEKIDISLVEFGLGNVYFWIRKTDRSSVPRLTDTAHLTAQLEDYTKMLSKNPNDTILIDMVEKMRRHVRASQIEEEARLDYSGNPIKYTIDFLSLEKEDLEKFRSTYNKIDKDRDSFISLDEFRLFMGKNIEAMSKYSDHIFTVSIGHPPKDDKLDFGCTIKAISIFCMLSTEEILRFIFSVFDTKGFGCLENAEFLELLNMLHPKHKGQTIRALSEFDLPENGRMTFEQFKSIQMRFPNLLYPAFEFQEKIRIKFMGIKFWERKLRKFMAVKEKIRRDYSMAESIANETAAKQNLMSIYSSVDSDEKQRNKSGKQNKGSSMLNRIRRYNTSYLGLNKS